MTALSISWRVQQFKTDLVLRSPHGEQCWKLRINQRTQEPLVLYVFTHLSASMSKLKCTDVISVRPTCCFPDRMPFSWKDDSLKMADICQCRAHQSEQEKQIHIPSFIYSFHLMLPLRQVQILSSFLCVPSIKNLTTESNRFRKILIPSTTIRADK